MQAQRRCSSTRLLLIFQNLSIVTRNKEGKRFIDEISRVLPTKGNDFELMKLYTNEGGDHFVRHCSTDILTEIAQYKG